MSAADSEVSQPKCPVSAVHQLFYKPCPAGPVLSGAAHILFALVELLDPIAKFLYCSN